MFGGLGGLSSIFGLILQIGLIVFVVRMAMSWWQRRHATAPAYAGARRRPGRRDRASAPEPVLAWDRAARRLKSLPADYEAFERLLGEIQAAWSNEDVARLHTLATPEMVSYFTKDLEANQARNVDQQGLRHQAVAGRPCGSLARGRYRLCQRGDAVLAGRQDRSTAPAAGWSRAASSRPKPRKSGPSCGRAAPTGSCRRSSRPDRPRQVEMQRRRG